MSLDLTNRFPPYSRVLFCQKNGTSSYSHNPWYRKRGQVTLNEPHPDPRHKKQQRCKRPGSAKRRKTDELTIHETIPVPLEELPEGTPQNGYAGFVVQGSRRITSVTGGCATCCPTAAAERPRCRRTSRGISGRHSAAVPIVGVKPLFDVQADQVGDGQVAVPLVNALFASQKSHRNGLRSR